MFWFFFFCTNLFIFFLFGHLYFVFNVGFRGFWIGLHYFLLFDLYDFFMHYINFDVV